MLASTHLLPAYASQPVLIETFSQWCGFIAAPECFLNPRRSRERDREKEKPIEITICVWRKRESCVCVRIEKRPTGYKYSMKMDGPINHERCATKTRQKVKVCPKRTKREWEKSVVGKP